MKNLTFFQEYNEYINKLNKELKKGELKDLYYGFCIIEGKIKQNIDFLFIGINPGSGSKDKHYKVNSDPEISYLDMWDDEYKYPLAEHTIKYLENAGITNNSIKEIFQNKSLKTNLFPIITNNLNDLKKFFNVNNFVKNSLGFIGDLIKYTKPKIIIAEGKFVFDYLYSFFENNEIKKYDWKNGAGYLIPHKEHFVIIGYSRCYSNIQNISKVSELIKKFYVQ
ncbi:hypothetical protein ETU10_03700 [Apibacter muscae]|uniref:hypothetical protein n=1 Tax=Apibacter muscae TaxID=2509004 RepID=UPI0011AC4372|nr:hypothetical protein [Apibacter muscae]TWP24357.1 hypothetical protein ETU10_03700 [Apibacter muscae]